MVEARWNGEVIAASDDTVVVEGNHYFPGSSVRAEYLADSGTTSTCPWKGTARYKTLVVSGERNEDAAWYYPSPKPEAAKVAGRYAFWNGVEVG